MTDENQYDKIGSNFINGQKNYFSNRIDYAREFIKSKLPGLKGKEVLDVGCGHGVDITTYEKLGAKEVYGIDTSKFMVEEARKIVKKPENLIVGNMNSIPLKNKSVDVVTSRFSLHYLYELDKAYVEFARLLKDNGTLLIVTHHPLLSFVQTGSQNYATKNKVKMQLYDNEVSIEFPHHTLKEFLSDTFFDLFHLDYLDEESLENPEYENKKNLPGYIAFKAIKKREK